MATINLGSIKFNWKGAYNGATAYAVDDVVSSGGSSYVCILASTGNATSNGTYWEQMSSAGTNGTDGTDLTSTLTTQGDILYRDGSGLQRLAKGTANQELRINSGATAPEWYTPAVATSDFVKLHEVSSSGSDVAITVDNYFSSTYDHYKIIIDHAAPATNTYDGYNLRLLNASGTVQTSSNYRSGFHFLYLNSGSNSQGSIREWDNDHFRLQNDVVGAYADNYKPFWCEFDILDPLDTGSKTRVYWRSNSDDGSGVSEYVNLGSGYYNDQIATRGFQFLSRDGDAIASQCTIKLYGIK
ncbi:hypothetical protein N9I13_00285 [bacterium]|nr:hypothetical protein [bacterium]